MTANPLQNERQKILDFLTANGAESPQATINEHVLMLQVHYGSGKQLQVEALNEALEQLLQEGLIAFIEYKSMAPVGIIRSFYLTKPNPEKPLVPFRWDRWGGGNSHLLYELCGDSERLIAIVYPVYNSNGTLEQVLVNTPNSCSSFWSWAHKDPLENAKASCEKLLGKG